MVEKILSKEDIVACEDLPPEKVYVKEWKGHVYVKPITLGERIKWEGAIKPEDPSLSAYTLLIHSLCDAAGQPIFTEADLPTLRKKNAAAILRLFKIAQRVSKLRGKDIEEEIKNCESPAQD
jgi:hypothetical protein